MGLARLCGWYAEAGSRGAAAASSGAVATTLTMSFARRRGNLASEVRIFNTMATLVLAQSALSLPRLPPISLPTRPPHLHLSLIHI